MINLLTTQQSSFESNTPLEWINAGNASISRSNADAAPNAGTFSLRAAVVSSASNGIVVQSDRFSLQKPNMSSYGSTYGWVRKGSGTTVSGRLYLMVYNTADVFITSASSPLTVLTEAWQNLTTTTGVAGVSGAEWGRIMIQIGATGVNPNPLANDFYFIDNVWSEATPIVPDPPPPSETLFFPLRKRQLSSKKFTVRRGPQAT